MLKRIGIIGGSFDPIHDGHLMMAKTILKQKIVDHVMFVVAKAAPLKHEPIAPFDVRVHLAKLASVKLINTSVSTIEADLPSPSYTIETIKALIKKTPASYFLVLGADQVQQLDQWKDIDQLKQLVTFVLFKRPDYPLTINGLNNKLVIEHPLMDVSSTLIRQGKSIQTPIQVRAAMIKAHCYDQSILANYLSQKRINHVQAVTSLAVELARIHGANIQQVRIAATYHDIAKELSQVESERWMKRVAPNFMHYPEALWHSFIGAAMLKQLYGIHDKVILSAIQHHILGASAHLVSKIVFVADKIEPTRSYDTSALIKLAKKDIHQAVRIVKTMNKQYNKDGGVS